VLAAEIVACCWVLVRTVVQRLALLRLRSAALHALADAGRRNHILVLGPMPRAPALLLLSTICCSLQILLVFYQYYIDYGMMGRRQGWQYPQMLAKHLAPRLGWSVASVVTVGQVGRPCRGAGRGG
jgi:hypothetical protein